MEEGDSHPQSPLPFFSPPLPLFLFLLLLLRRLSKVQLDCALFFTSDERTIKSQFVVVYIKYIKNKMRF